jgi:hypothetical protein
MSAALDRLLEELPCGLAESLSSIFLRISHALSTQRTIADAVPTMLAERLKQYKRVFRMW